MDHRTTTDTRASSTAVDPELAPRALTVAALASIGAGAIHAAAAGAHSEHRQAVWVFAALAAAQIAWGVVALARPLRILAPAGALLSLVAVVGWATAKAVGIGAVDGLGAAEPIQWADGLAAALALVALVGCAGVLSRGWSLAPLTTFAAPLVVVAALPGMVLAGSHAHEGGSHDDGEVAAHDHDGEDPEASTDDVAADGEDHDDHDATDDGRDEQVAGGGDHDDHDDAVVAPQPYDPALPIDLSGVEGVTPEQQARAENLIAITLHALPRFADPAVAEAEGWHSIGDGGTGYEHFVNWPLINDDKILDPDFPESLVYQVIGGQKTLVAAMYMLPDEYTLDTVPDLGGPLTQWHIHDNLCYTPDPVAPKVAGLRAPGGDCRQGLVPGNENAMIHVWIVPHECGPFAALEGVGGGTIAAGEERWCDHAHGA